MDKRWEDGHSLQPSEQRGPRNGTMELLVTCQENKELQERLAWD